MKHSVLVLGVVCAGLVAPSFAADFVQPTKLQKHHVNNPGVAGKPPMVTPMVMQNQDEPEFGEALVKPYVEDMQGMLQAMQSIKTRADAIAFQKKFGEVMPNVEKNLRRVRHSMARAVEKGIKTPDMEKGEALLGEVEKRGDQFEQEMRRIEKLNPNIKVMFKKFNDIHED